MQTKEHATVRRRLARSLALALAVVLAALPAAPAAAAGKSFVFSYSGRLTEPNGGPVEGPVALAISFYSVATGGTPILTITDGLANVTLQEGMFQVSLTLAGSALHAAFPSVTDSVYIEVTDLTNRPDVPYDRQLVAMVPYAAKVPVDGVTLEFNGQGELTLKASPTSGASAITAINAATAGTIAPARLPAIGGDVTGTLDAAVVGKLQGRPLATTAPASGDYLKWNGTAWAPAALAGGAGGTAAYGAAAGAAANAIYVDADGKVGIGTTLPSAPVSVLSSSINTSADIIKTNGSFVSTDASTYNHLNIFGTINQGGVGTGITRGVFVNIALAGAADFRGFETTNNTGYGIYQSGAGARNYFAGNVGIGTSSPSAALSVQEKMLAAPGVADGATAVAYTLDTANTLSTAGSKLLSVKNNGTEVLNIKPGSAAGDVGTGNTVNFARFSFIGGPTSALHMSGRTVIQHGGADSTELLDVRKIANTGTVPMRFEVGNGNERMRIETDGKVGIGTNSPGSLLSVNGATATNTLNINGALGTATPHLKLGTMMSTADPGGSGIVLNTDSIATGNVQDLSTPALGTGAGYVAYSFNPMTIFAPNTTQTSSYNVLIKGAVKGGLATDLTSTTALGIDSANVVSTGTVARSYGLLVNAQTGATSNYAAAFSGGRVGIGTTTPTDDLEVAGNVKVSGTGQVKMGLYYARYAASSAAVRCACPANSNVMSGGCFSSTHTNVASYPSAEASDGTTLGTMVANGATSAGSWTCEFGDANASNTCMAVCARMGN